MALAALVAATALAGCAREPERWRTGDAGSAVSAQHRVARGDTVYAISRRYGVRPQAIRTMNRLDSQYRIHVGQRLLIPGPAPTRYAATSARRPAPVRQAAWRPSRPAPAPAPAARRELSDPTIAPRTNAAASGGPNRLMRPVAGDIIRPYGEVAGGRRNSGVDIAAPAGAPVVAAADGEIAFVSDPTSPVGAVILMQHPRGMTTIYGRLVDIEVGIGQKVRRGQTLARVAARRFDRSALHFEVRQGSEPVNPTPYL